MNTAGITLVGDIAINSITFGSEGNIEKMWWSPERRRGTKWRPKVV